jgi:competence protein ComEC
MTNKTNTVVIMVLIFMALDVVIWREMFAAGFLIGRASLDAVAHDYFLDVGQGDSELIIFPGDIKVMTDAGPTDQVLTSLANVMPPGDDYIDLAIISHPQLDHFNGYHAILDHYRVGAFIYNGRDDDPGVAQWPALKAKIAAKGISLITLGGGDKILIGGSSDNEVNLLSPSIAFAQSAELNDTGFIELVRTPEFRTLLTADTGFNVEDWLVANHLDIRADVLKVGHHGSAYSSGNAFLHAVHPELAAIEVGAKNTYGHPGSSTLARLASDTDALIVRTDRDGTVEVYPEDGKLKVKKEK